jgi:dipeptidyl aminopeptidase/acylaminoacyl peptidase
MLFASDFRKAASDCSRDGRIVLFSQFGSTTRQDMWALSLPDRKAAIILQTEFFESAPAFSPDGRWIVYHSDESGRQEVYVRPFPGPGPKWRISREGGNFPRWRGDGKEIFFSTDDGKLMAVGVTIGGTFTAGDPKLLFAVHLRRTLSREYDATPDGQRFLVAVAPSDDAVPPITLVQNWQGALKR